MLLVELLSFAGLLVDAQLVTTAGPLAAKQSDEVCFFQRMLVADRGGNAERFVPGQHVHNLETANVTATGALIATAVATIGVDGSGATVKQRSPIAIGKEHISIVALPMVTTQNMIRSGTPWLESVPMALLCKVLVISISVSLLWLFASLVCVPAGSAIATSLHREGEQIRTKSGGMPLPIFAVSAFFIALNSTCTDHYQANMPEMAVQLGCSQQEMSFTFQLNWLVKAASMLIVGPVCDNLGRAPTFSFCCILLLFSTTCCALAPSYTWFVAARCLQGIGEGGEAVVFAAARDYYADETKRTQVMTAFAIFMAVGAMIGSLCGGWIGSWIGWRYPFLILAFLLLVCLLGGRMVLVESAPLHTDVVIYLREVVTVLSDVRLFLLMLCSGLSSSIQMTIASNSAFVMENEYRTTASQAALLYFMYISCAFPGAIGPGMFSFLGPFVLAKWYSSVIFILATIPMIIVGIGFRGSLTCFAATQCFAAAASIGFNISVLTLLTQPTKKIAATAAAVFVACPAVLSSLFSLGGSALTAHIGARGLIFAEAGAMLMALVIFWVGFGLNPPDWVHEISPEGQGEDVAAVLADNDNEKENGLNAN